MPISFSDSELAAVIEAARPIPPRDRDAFLRDVAAELAKHPEIGPGVVDRVVREIQRRHLPARTGHNLGSKYGHGRDRLATCVALRVVVVDNGGPYVKPSPKAYAPAKRVPLNPADIEGLQGFEEDSVGIGARRRFRMGSVDRD